MARKKAGIKRKNRLLRIAVSVVLLAAMALTPFAAAQAATAGSFGDVSASSWYYNAVDFVVGRGLFQGTSTTAFSPGAAMTRGMFITVLGRYANVDAGSWLTGTVSGSGVNLRSGAGTDTGVVTVLDQGTSLTIKDRAGDWYQVSTASGDGYINASYVSPRYHSFSDVGYGKYYAGYTVWAYEKGVVTGDGDASTFNPNGNITRQEVCTMLSRFASVMGIGLSQTTGDTTFADDGSISSWARDSVYSMQRSGIVQGNESGAFNPRNPITRAETAAMIQRFDSACGGFAPSVQRPPEAQTQTPETQTPETQTPETQTPETQIPETSQPGTGEGEGVPPSDAGDVTDTPATLLGSSVGIPASVIRVGLADMVTTGSFRSSITTLSLQDVGGAGFTYGYMDGRSFVSAGVTASGSITVTTDGWTFTATDSYGNVYTASGDAFAVRPSSGATCVNGGKTYRGDIEMRQASGMPGYISVINCVGIEDFVKGVLPNEFGTYWPLETLKAAAVASRTHIMSMVNGAYSAYSMDVVANDGSQFYGGQTTDGSAVSDQAVDATAGQYLTYGGSLCVTAYSACNGGRIRSSAEAGWGDKPYLVAKDDPYEAAVAGEIGDWAGRASVSHRVGMSQWGAYSMAKVYGKTYDVILGFYFPGTNIQYGA